MATTTTCDVCENNPRAAGEDYKPTKAEWRVSAKSLSNSTIETIDELDCCVDHLGHAAWAIATKTSSHPHFCRVEVSRV